MSSLCALAVVWGWSVYEAAAERITLLPENAAKSAHVPTKGIGDDWRAQIDFNDSNWSRSTDGVGGVGYDTLHQYDHLISLDVNDVMYEINSSCYIRALFTLSAEDACDLSAMTLNVRYDDGYVAFLNGQRIGGRNDPNVLLWNSDTNGVGHSDAAAMNFEALDVSAHVDALKAGDNLLAIHGLNILPASSDFLISFELVGWSGPLQSVIYVDGDAPGAADGSSWENACPDLQDALARATPWQPVTEIRVAEGTYSPAPPGGSPGAYFHLLRGLTIKGGYAGFSAPDPDERNVRLYETILSGDINRNDNPSVPREYWRSDPSRSDNSRAIVRAMGLEEPAVLDGLTITGAVGSDGAMYITSAKAEVANCTFADNAADRGGAVFSGGSDTVFSDCTFRGNWAFSGPGGGAMYNSGSRPTVIDCTFVENQSENNSGGAVYNSSCQSVWTRCTFVGNTSKGPGGAVFNGGGELSMSECVLADNVSIGSNGGAIYSVSARTRLTNCLLAGNSAQTQAGGAFCTGPEASLGNCTFSGNRALSGSAGAIHLSAGQTLLTNSIIWYNTPEEIYGFVMPTYCLIPGHPGQGNIYTDPMFADPGYWADEGDLDLPTDARDPDAVWVDGDYHLQSRGGRYDAAAQEWVTDGVTSPCIDAGDPMSPIGHEPFANGGIVNMGAYGGTTEASKSDFGKPACETIAAGDVNGDCVIDFQDFTIMALHWCEDNAP
ncbi:MAG: right-handed parallel beta-helix repeat-containing protein [Phycisphaerales bacterium]|nr:MAG: right-handed parallel beta-helix repeat-containing protein [Phycisphaerales bacterium]